MNNDFIKNKNLKKYVVFYIAHKNFAFFCKNIYLNKKNNYKETKRENI